MLLTTLLTLGAMPPLPRKEVNLGEVEAVTRELQAAGIDVLEVVSITGPEDFVANDSAKAAAKKAGITLSI